MKKINLVSGFGAKFAVAAFAVAGLTLTSCEKEDFEVNTPNISVIVPSLPEAEQGVAYVIVSASSSTGATLSGVKFDEISADGGTDVSTDGSHTLYKFVGQGGSVTVKASKDGYEAVIKTQVVPAPAKDSYTTYSLNFVLNSLVEDVVVVPGEVIGIASASTMPDNVPTDNFDGNYVAGEHEFAISVPVGLAYSDAQIAALYAEVDALEGPVTRASEEEQANLESARGALREKIAALPRTYGYEKQPILIYLPKPATNVTVTINTIKEVERKVEISVVIAGKTYAVSGTANEASEYTKDDMTITADNDDITHSHDHGHGGENSGGGTSGK